MANIKKQIDKSQVAIRDVMQTNLAVIAQSIIDQIMAKARKSTPSTILNSTKNITPKGQGPYRSDLKATLAVISSDSLEQARKEVPKAKNVKLMESEERLLFGEFENLPPKIKNRINNANQLLIGTQIADLEKTLFFQFNSSATSDKPIKEIEADLNEKAEKYITGTSVQTGSALTATTTVNEARNAFFFDDKTLEEIEAFQFMNASPVSPICQDLAGQYFPKDDPNAFRYTPPLHFNCKSWIRPVLRLPKSAKVEKLAPTKTAAKSIQFDEGIISCHCCG